ncbi:flagellar hook-associated protein 1 [Neobacillus bataviensis LMG 21833]|uniref:Flagellar hook-associated protein 1 n=1 Tax=Neobacillus bataviensis LMG 21833 TaxID=1117379 RepID=K6DV75_9BACI|nr:flagellar hook-associated protein FlgK [Neobacillus bataviensis]EKN64726.1 flagellar hook-associated protein 1 [Neobacillus bataviensis LMG 21833]
MSSTFHGIEIGKRAIFAQQTALSVTGHNIANANTEGYTRQNAITQASNPLSYPGMNVGNGPLQFGTGVETKEINRIRDSFLDGQFRSQNEQLGYWDVKHDTLSKIEGTLNEPTDNGLQASFDRFWQSWEDVSKEPDSLAARAALLSNANALAGRFNQISNSMDQLSTDLQNQLSTNTQEMNNLTKQVSALNVQIAKITASGQQPNDLLDQRDLLIDKMSKMADITVRPAGNGMVDVLVGQEYLVKGDQNYPISFDATTNQTKLNGKNISFTSGEMAGMVESLTKDIPSFMAKINELVTVFSREVNQIHRDPAAMNLDDIQSLKNDPNAVTDQIPFFVAKGGTGDPTTAGEITINPLILSSLNKIAAARTANVSDAGNANLLNNLKFKNVSFSNQSTTMNNFYRTIVGDVGIKTKEAMQMGNNSDILVQQAESRRQSVSGVSIDEEMTNMVRFQQSYNAASRYISVMDEVLDKLINGTGRVGI